MGKNKSRKEEGMPRSRMREFLILNKGSRKSSLRRWCFSKVLREVKGWVIVCIWGERIPGRETATTKILSWSVYKPIWGRARRPVWAAGARARENVAGSDIREATLIHGSERFSKGVVPPSQGHFENWWQCFWLSQRWQRCSRHVRGGGQWCQKPCQCLGQSHSLGNCHTLNSFQISCYIFRGGKNLFYHMSPELHFTYKHKLLFCTVLI